MLRVHSVSKSYGADPVLENISFVLNPGERIGLVGPNGAGKSTLLRIVAGEIRPDSGHVWVDPAASVAYLPQYPLDELHLTIRAALLRGAGRVGALSARLAALERALSGAGGEELDRLLADYAQTREEFERLDGYALEARMEAVVGGLRLDVDDLTIPVAALSGGNKTKLSLGRLLLSGATILLLDEPTNYLDLPALLWLERFIADSNRSFLIVSHDRRFLDRTVHSILELDAETHAAREWAGAYSDYAEAKLREQQKKLEAYRDQQAEIARIEEDIRRTREQARGTENRFKSGLGADHQRRIAKKVAKKAKVRERRLEKKLESDDMIEKPKRGWRLHLVDLGRNGVDDDRVVLEADNVRAGYGDREILRGASLLVRGRDRVALMGENGSGKSTFLRCLRGGLPLAGNGQRQATAQVTGDVAEGETPIHCSGQIKLGPSIRAGFLSQEAEELPLDRSVLDLFRSRTTMTESEARTYLHKFLFAGQEVFKPVRALSYGQRSKLALAILVLSDANFLVLDEPTSHMDMPALEAIERALEEFVGPLLVVSHDRYFLERIGITRVEVLEDGVLRSVISVEEYEEEVGRV